MARLIALTDLERFFTDLMGQPYDCNTRQECVQDRGPKSREGSLHSDKVTMDARWCKGNDLRSLFLVLANAQRVSFVLSTTTYQNASGILLAIHVDSSITVNLGNAFTWFELLVDVALKRSSFISPRVFDNVKLSVIYIQETAAEDVPVFVGEEDSCPARARPSKLA